MYEFSNFIVVTDILTDDWLTQTSFETNSQSATTNIY